MSRAISTLVLLVAALAVCTAPLAQADTFNLNAIYCNCLPSGSSAGTVEITQQSANVVQISVNLAAGLTFHQSGGLDAFVFNGPAGLTASNVTVGAGWTFGASGHEDGAGNFRYQLTCVAAPNGCVGDPSTLVFTIAGTVAQFETTNGGSSNSFFAANVANPTQSGCTGMVGAGGSGPSGGFTGSSNCGVPNVPEPTSIAFFGTGLIALGFVIRRKFSTQN